MAKLVHINFKCGCGGDPWQIDVNINSEIKHLDKKISELEKEINELNKSKKELSKRLTPSK